MKNKFIHNRYGLRVFWIVVIIALWQIVAVREVFNPVSFPRIETILSALIKDIMDGSIIVQTLFSLQLILKGLFIGVTLALILSAISMTSYIFESFVETVVTIAHPLPGIALLPLVILWMGVGEEAIIFIIVHSVIWPMILNLRIGFKSIPKIYKQIGKNYGLSDIDIIIHILVPAAFPYFISALKIGWARAWRAVISAEMVFGAAGGNGGIGWFIFKKRVFMDTPGIFGGLIVIIFIGIIVEDILFNILEKKTIRKWGMSI
ncbi:ABC transporter permease [Clostridium sp. DL1XJH146]